MSVRVRFAPSPTGHVHIGNIRVAIFNWLFARHEGGKFLLRIEDTDRERSTPEAVATLLDALAWLGLNHDEPPVYQSARLDAHRAAAERLLKSGAAYRQDKGDTGRGECVVFRMPPEDVAFHDEVRGDLRKAAADIPDFVIVRSDGTPVFHLGNVVDDIEMGITHAIRGDDHIENTFRHLALYRALGATAPKFAHLPMITNAQGKPYSKRDGDAYVGDLRSKGFHPGAVFNYLSLLGWSPGEDREKMTREEAASLFTLDRVKSAPAQMDVKKMLHLNAEYVAEMPAEDFVAEVRRVAAAQPWGQAPDEGYFRRVCGLMQTRTHLYSYARDWGYFFVEEPAFDARAAEKHIVKAGSCPALALVRRNLEPAGFAVPEIEQAIRAAEREAGIPEGKLNQAVRVAVTGTAIGAGLYETLELIGKPRTMARLARAVERLGGAAASA